MSLRRGLGLIVFAAALAACGPQHSVRVDPQPEGADAGRRPAPASTPAAGAEYRVVRGDTLYGIAFRHGLDYRQLAEANRIGAPYTIYPGQRLRLPPRPAPVASRAPTPPVERGRSGVVAPIVQDRAGTSRAGSATVRAGVPAPVAAEAPPTGPGSSAAATPAAPKPPGPPAAAGPLRWSWPADGSLVSSFAANDPTRQGLNIAGSAGQPVRAAARGVVVYSGAGLIGYGELVIIKHSDEWLSAYGHNRKRLVGEGDAVQAGQQIAEMGRSGASRDMLHFEIRRNGRPVDPLGLLPGKP